MVCYVKFVEHYLRNLLGYVRNGSFQVHFGEAISSPKSIGAWVPEVSLYLLYTADAPQIDATLATHADDTAILVKHKDYTTTVTSL